MQPSTSFDEFDYEMFQRYLQGIAGGNRSQETAKAISHDVQLFFDSTPHCSSTSALHILLNNRNLEEFYNLLKDERQYKPTTVAEKLRRMKMAIQFLLHQRDTDTKDDEAIAKQRQAHGIKMSNMIVNTTNPYEFLKSTQVLKKLNTAKQNLKQAIFSPTDIQLVTAYAAALIVYKNGQRSGVVQNLTMEEFAMRRSAKQNFVIISCINHKTGPQGRAKLVVDQEDFSHMLDYKTLVRDYIIPNVGCDDLFFLTHTGARYTQVYRKIVESIHANHLFVTIPPPPSSHRIVVTTSAACSIEWDLTRRKVNKHLCHSDKTSEQYYEFTNENEAVEAYCHIQKLANIRSKTEGQ